MPKNPTKGRLLVVTCVTLVVFTSVTLRRLLAQTANATTRVVVDRFNDVFNQHDPDALALLLSEDTVFEDTSPAPDGRRIEGKAAVAAF